MRPPAQELASWNSSLQALPTTLSAPRHNDRPSAAVVAMTVKYWAMVPPRAARTEQPYPIQPVLEHLRTPAARLALSAHRPLEAC